MQRYQKNNYHRTVKIAKAERAVLLAAVGCIDKRGYAFRVATEQIARTYFVNEKALTRLEKAVANLKEARQHRPVKRHHGDSSR